jgi:ADP-ribosyl-[dinitrogen reductase] hydrolase
MGKQTREALQAIESGAEPLTAAECHVTKNGNGSLMRALPTALWFYNSKDSREFAHECMGISHITHPHPYSKYSCILYNMIAQQLIRGMPLEAAISHSKSEIQFLGLGLLRPMLDYVLDEKQHPPKGDFFVINTLWSAIAAIRTTDNFRDAIITSISYGNDTDTTACVAGGLAGILYGFSELPPNWLLLLRDKNIVEPLAQKLLDHNARTH